MDARTLAQIQPSNGDLALNALIFGYGGHSLVTPHTALKQLWWTNKRIDAKVTEQFVFAKLRGHERAFLHEPLRFGEGLTDHTYLEWILDKAKRLFLILADIGAPDQIFGCIDSSYTDEDLPISLIDIPRLALSYEYDKALNEQFYKAQFKFLLRTLSPGAHIDYGPQEHIPIELIGTLAPAASIQAWDRVHLPEDQRTLLVRRRFPLTSQTNGEDMRSTFLQDVRRAKSLAHHHIFPVWGSYTSCRHGYVLSDFVPDHTLRSFIQHRTPSQLMRLSEADRLTMISQWMHCLSDALAYLHSTGSAHGKIKPSNILINKNNEVAFADIGSIVTFQQEKKEIKDENYDYSAPEMIQQKSIYDSQPINASRSSLFSFSRLRKRSTGSSNTSSASDTSSALEWEGGSVSTSRTSTCSGSSSNYTLPSLSFGQHSFISSISSPTTVSSISQDDDSDEAIAPPRPSMSTMSTSTYLDQPRFRDLFTSRPEASDIYSLGCVFLDIITFMIEGKLNTFVKFRRSKIQPIATSYKTSTDSSFHANPTKVNIWMDLLKAKVAQETDPVLCAVPAMLSLVESMLMRNPLLRPTAFQVRDRLADILAITCGLETLCCTGRDWSRPNLA